MQQPRQTLGEEFCDIIRVTKSGSKIIEPVGIQRHVLVLACTVLPSYLVARSQSGWTNLSQLTRTPRERMEQQIRFRQEAELADTVNKGGVWGPPLEHKMAVLNPQRLLRRLDWFVSKLKAMRVWLEILTHVEATCQHPVRVCAQRLDAWSAPFRSWIHNVAAAVYHGNY
uniref:Pex N-terminal domain-containing protein n=1 Tax=Hyaloperonospora arabidopsidis (strain Emoy2) TaxID=559515 RepID=M4BWX5_HYAAE